MISALFVAAMLTGGAARAEDWPSGELRYVFYIAGQYSGENTVKITESSGVVKMETVCKVNFMDFNLDFTSSTEVASQTYAPLYYSFQGTRMNESWSGTTSLTGDSVVSDLEIKGDHFPNAKKVEGRKFFVENYVTGHHILILRAADRNQTQTMRFTAFMPSDGISTDMSVSSQTEIEFTETKKPVYCHTFVYNLPNAEPFAAYFDPDRGIPIYMNFPGTRTEVFLASDYSEHPKTRYELTEKEREAMGND